jgi:hypothetical protein
MNDSKPPTLWLTQGSMWPVRPVAGTWMPRWIPASLLWDDVQAYARGLLGQVHALARAYGWTEHEVLSLSPRRRAAYLEMTGG